MKLDKLMKDFEGMDLSSQSKEIIKEMLEEANKEYRFINRISFIVIGLVIVLLLVFIYFNL